MIDIPTKRMFDLVLITIILVQPAKGLIKMVVNRRVQDRETGPVGTTIAGASRILL